MSSKSLRLVKGLVPCLVLIAAVAASAQSTATIDFGTTFQTIRCFGGANAWMPAFTSAQANALFGTGANQLGLTCLRERIDDSTTTPGTSNWGDALSSAQSASALGALVIASPWGAPAAWKDNNSTVQGSLLPAHYADYANYLESFVQFLKSGGVNLYAMSMQNEPDATVTYDSMVWNAQQMDTWVANNSSVLTTKLIMPESENFNSSLAATTLSDPNAVGHVAIVGGHIYGVSPSFQSQAESAGKEVWMTEHYLTPSGAEPAISDAVAFAEEIHNSMVTGQYNAYVWWWMIDWNPGTGCCTNYGLIDTNSSPTFYGLAEEMWAKWVLPGYVRVSATPNPGSNILIDAYKGPSSSTIMATNTGGSAVSQTFSISGQTVSSVTPFQLTSSGQVTKLTSVSVANNTFTFTLPAQSITSFVTSAGSGGSCTAVPSAPSSLSASAASSSSILLDWSSVSAPSGCSVGYDVFRSTTSGFTPSSSNQVATGLTGTSFTDSGLAASTTYFYKVVAVDGAGSSAASPQASATTQSGGGSGLACRVAYSILNQWPGGFTAGVNIENTGTTNISSWTLTWTFADGQTVSQLWNGAVGQSGANVTVNNLSYNGSIPAGTTYTGMGFNGTWNNSTNAVPASFAINGTTCN